MAETGRKPPLAWRRALARLLVGAGELPDVQRQQAETLRQAVAEIAELRRGQSQAPESTGSWVRNAENHLAALQTGYDRLQSILERQTEQVARVIARQALLDARLTDLERADTAIAAAIGKTASSDRLE